MFRTRSWSLYDGIEAFEEDPTSCDSSINVRLIEKAQFLNIYGDIIQLILNLLYGRQFSYKLFDFANLVISICAKLQ